MAKTVVPAVVTASPQVVRWETTSTGAEEPHEVGHNQLHHTVVVVNSGTGNATLSIEVSFDGTTWIAHPDLADVSVAGGAAFLRTLTLSTRYVRPNITSGANFTLTIWLVSAR